MVIQHNMAAMFTNRQLNISETNKADSSEKLATGYRINRAADDAAGLTISEKMRWQIRGLDKASDNILEGISLIQVADGALNESHAVLQRMNELAVQAANDTNTEVDRDAIQCEMDELSEELTRIAVTTSYNDGIYPLVASEETAKIEMPDAIQEVTLSITNDTGADVRCNGTVYHDGEVMSLPGAVWYSGTLMSMGSLSYETSMGTGTTFYSAMFNSTTAKVTDATYQNIKFSPDETYTLYYATWAQVEVDENGYLYCKRPSTSNWSNDRFYFTRGGLDLIRDDTGWFTDSPTAEQCEKAGCLRAEIIPGQARGGIKLQTSCFSGQAIEIPLVDAKASTLGVEYLDVMTYTYASKAITKIQNAISKVSEYRSMFGAYQNRLEHAMANVDNTALNVQDAESKLRDTDMAGEMVRYSTASIISQAANSMLAQAGQMNQGVLSLLE